MNFNQFDLDLILLPYTPGSEQELHTSILKDGRVVRILDGLISFTLSERIALERRGLEVRYFQPADSSDSISPRSANDEED